ncbi:hypothetical protein CCAND93_670009 [Capnocytophaga canis]|uniref:Uncharacterized protein n=1 Tax=Capnocytophaga canis TaxID=1848903 RepID=A0A0B7IQ04_9FLAO|nr:hypothetical protein [Capnocytophaga canis]CEN53971.1 hypothetical protein CCAND93_670009 [Capnocytophaga canis]
MLCKDRITAIFCIIDDILKEICPVEDKRRKISDSEVILTAVLVAKISTEIIVLPFDL